MRALHYSLIIFAIFLSHSFLAKDALAVACEASARHDEIRKELGRKCRHNSTRLRCVDIIAVGDGDTIALNIPKVHPYFGKNTSVRLYGLDTPEKRPPSVKCLPLPKDRTARDEADYENCLAAKKLRKCEIDAAAQAAKLLKNAVCTDSDRIDIEFARDKKNQIIREKYGRVLGNLIIMKYPQGVNSSPREINAQTVLLDQKLAFHYDGGKKKTRDWCRKRVVRKRELQKDYVQEHFCSGRKCTEQTRKVRCLRKRGFKNKVGCYQDRIAKNISPWFRICNSQSGEERRNCYLKKAENYLGFCTMFATLADSKACREELSITINSYCGSLRGAKASDCMASTI